MVHLLAALVLSIFLTGCSHHAAFAQGNFSIGEHEYEIEGVRIAKSSSVRLSALPDASPDMLGRSIYLRPGTYILLLRHYRRDSETRRKYQLAVTHNGLLVYVLASQYYHPDRFRGYADGLVAIPVTNHEVSSEIYGPITFTPSETYRFEFQESPYLEIIVDDNKIKENYTTEDRIRVDEKYFAIVAVEELSDLDRFSVVRRYDVLSELADVIESVSDMDSNAKEKLLSFAKRKFIRTKGCDDKIVLAAGIQGELGLDISNWLSPIDAKLALTGGVDFSTTYDRGVSFTVERYQLAGQVYEIKEEAVAPDCIVLEDKQRIRIAGTHGEKAHLDSQDHVPLDLGVTAKGRLAYSCREEYRRLFDSLVKEQDLSEAAARLLIARFTVFKYASDARRCAFSRQ